MAHDEGTCRSKNCKASIVWVTLVTSGKPHPVDPVPSENGTIKVFLEDGRRYGRVLPRDQRRGRLYVSHFATCPDAARFRQAAD